MWGRFERLVADGRPAALEQIAGLYRGDLLAGLAPSARSMRDSGAGMPRCASTSSAWMR